MDEFQLYDLRVEVVCPPGKRIMCGAKEGDYFTLKGEMMYLPPGQGISIYSLGACGPPELQANLFRATLYMNLQPRSFGSTPVGLETANDPRK